MSREYVGVQLCSADDPAMIATIEEFGGTVHHVVRNGYPTLSASGVTPAMIDALRERGFLSTPKPRAKRVRP